MPLETSAPGLYAVGDVRAGAVKRVASAVGEGSVVVSQVHARLEEVRAGAGYPSRDPTTDTKETSSPG
jgi:thioredoxin reductase (NADPH)